MSYQAHIQCAAQFAQFKDELIEAAYTTLDYVDAEPGDVTIALTDPESIQELNLRFAGKNLPTDVLSFPDHSVDIDTRRVSYGDVIIAVPIAEQQAEVAGHSLEAELSLLTIHGVLHLLGFDHLQPEDRAKMWERQGEILDKLGYQIDPTEENR